MWQRAGGLNRFWLGVLGLLLLVGGVTTLGVASGQAARLLRAQAAVPTSDDVVVGDLTVWEHPAALVALVVGGLALVVLAVGWLLAQLPRSGRAADYHVSDQGASGLTTVSAGVLGDAVAADAAQVPGVLDVVVRGTAIAPELVVAVTAATDADLETLLAEIRSGVVERFAQAVGAPVRHIGVRLDLRRERMSDDRVTLA